MGEPVTEDADSLRIAFVYDAVYPWEKGGAQKRIWELARRMAPDHDVHLYGMKYWDGPSVIEREGVTLHGVCEPYDLYTNGRRSIPQALRLALAVTGPLLREDFDIIDCQEFPYFPIVPSKLHELLRSSTLVVTWYEVWDDYWFDYIGWKGTFGWLVERFTIHLGTEVVPISSHIATELTDLGRTGGISVTPNGVDFERLQGITPADAEWDVIYVGRLAEHKNVDVLLDAIALLAVEREISCCIIGDGPDRDDLESYARNLNIDDSVSFLGFVEDDDEVISHLKSSDVFVLPSKREGFPNTILEASACEVPSIVIDHPENGGRAIVEHGETGFVTDCNAEAIADAIERVVGDADTRASLSRNARAFGRDHDWSVIVDRLLDVYHDVSDPSARVPPQA